jgi:hypothetical protein
LQAELVWGLTEYLRGCAVVVAIENVPADRRARVDQARRIARELGKKQAVWAPTYSAIVRAGAENAAGDRASAVTWLREAERHAVEAELEGQASAVRYQLGKALGGVEGRELVERAERELRAEGVRSPERMATFHVPGRWA